MILNLYEIPGAYERYKECQRRRRFYASRDPDLSFVQEPPLLPTLYRKFRLKEQNTIEQIQGELVYLENKLNKHIDSHKKRTDRLK